ncbi:MAG: DUF433 domain-containing protein [Deltaproteobacteria bacterium]|nr:DUF433 domain-containing protein [Deltaproteobacteria bacterium]
MSWHDRIVVDSKIMVGKPVVRGTRLTVEFIIDLLAQGWNETDILDNYPSLSSQDVRACLHYAGELLREEKVFPIDSAQRPPGA